MHAVEKMMFTGKKPWWYGNQWQEGAVGVDLGDAAVTSAVAMREAGLDWLVRKTASAFQEIEPSEPHAEPGWVKVPGECFLLRDSDSSVLGRCSEQYEEFQNAEAFAFLDGLVADGSMVYHTAGSLEEGRRVWILGQTPTSWKIHRKSGADNTHHAFLLAMLGHDGKTGITLLPTDVRAECANTCGFADSRAEGQSLIFRIPHRGDINAKLNLAAKALQEMANESMERRKVLQAMAQQAMNSDEFIDFATSIFLGLDGEKEEVEAGVAKFYEDATDRSKTIMENRVADVTKLFVAGQGNEGDSMYDAIQGFTEYFDHFDISHIRDKIAHGKRAAKAVQSSWVGAGAERKSLVWKRLKQKLAA